MTRRPLRPEDAALWEAVISDVTPLRGAKPVRADGPRRARDVVPREHPARRHAAEPMRDLPPRGLKPAPQSLTGIDGARARRLQRGQLPVDARLDLHGMTQEKAYRTLGPFLARAQAMGKRVVLVVTGKGGAPRKDDLESGWREERTGVLRSVVPEWLAEGDNAARVVAWHPASPKHGGDGALYVVLRRLR
ncbi:MAG: DNA mismatch repair protein MutS [Alphaproteobacteria bacterium]|nr:DNA mismatch repair protein MutS [Alphaproteobacteria bacterium]